MECKVQAEGSCVSSVPAGLAAAGGMDVFGELTVGQLIRSGEGRYRLRPQDRLGDLARALAVTGRTALAVVKDDGEGGSLVGLVSENDVMRAFLEGTAAETSISEWLSSGAARAPARFLRRLVVPPSASLREVAGKMVSNALAGDCASHHVVVQGGRNVLFGVISSHDLVQALCNSEAWGCLQRANVVAAGFTVEDVMKSRHRVFACAPSDTIKDALRALLVTQQNSVLVMHEADASTFDLVTPRDMVKAFADGVTANICIEEWIRGRGPGADRAIESTAQLDHAAAVMTKRKVDHLVVVQPDTREAVGSISSLDILLRTRANAPFLRSVPQWDGPAVGTVLKRNHNLTQVCPSRCTFGQVADVLHSSSRTSSVVQFAGSVLRFGLITERDFVRAYIEGKRRHDLVFDWTHAVVPSCLQILPTTPLTEAASLMLGAAPHHTSHHLVVRSFVGEWLGVFSALDLARALSGLSSELDLARTGLEETTVDTVMTQIAFVPRCTPTDTIRSTLAMLDNLGHQAVLVEDEEKAHGLITPQCAVEALRRDVFLDCPAGAWLRASRRDQEENREVRASMPLADAARIMAANSLHHLLVVEDAGGPPVGVLSSLDLARAVVSTNYRCPFATLAWLRRFVDSAGSEAAAAGTSDSKAVKRPASFSGDGLCESATSPPALQRQRMV